MVDDRNDDKVEIPLPPTPNKAQQPLEGHFLLIIGDSRSHSDTPHSAVGLLWTSDQPEAETST